MRYSDVTLLARTVERGLNTGGVHRQNLSDRCSRDLRVTLIRHG